MIKHTSVILSAAKCAQSARSAKSKDPVPSSMSIRPRQEFSARTQNLFLCAIIVTVVMSSYASAQTLTGTVKNGTTGKPGAGDEVILLSLSQGMEESGRTKADAKGAFSFKLDNAQGPHLVRVIHQEVTYHRMAPPGSTSVEVEVYDVSKKVEEIKVVADIMRFQASQGQLQIERTFALQNNSKPPRTQMNERNLEFYVPDGATVTEGEAMTAGGQPVKSAPVPEGEKAKNKYAFLFPLRPGETRFNVVYTLPYTGSINIDPKSVYPLEHFVAIAPKSIEFSAAKAEMFKNSPFPGQPDANVEVASNTQLGAQLSFKLSGEGMLAQPPDENGQGGQAQGDNRPGGGLGPPIDAPDPLQKYRWWILGGFAAALVIGGVVVASRQQAANRAARAQASGFSAIQEDEEFEIPEGTSRSKQVSRSMDEGIETRPHVGSSRTSKLLEGLKEELFDLEVEHKQGRISQQEYEQTKAALDQTLQRALKREAAKQS
jgi:hypothetical protein